jgi:MFS family permease
MPSLDLYRKVGIYGGGLFFAITGMAQPFFTLFAQEMGASTSAIGFMVTLRALLPIFIAMPAGQMIDSIGPMKMLKWGSILLILSLFTTYYGNGIWMLSLSQLFMGASIVIMASALQVLVSDGEKNKRNENINKYSMWMSGGGMIGPLVGGGIVSIFASELVGYKTSFLISGVASIGFLLFILMISRNYPHPDPNAAEIKPRDIIRVKGIVDSYTSGWHLTKIRAVQFGLIATFLIMYIQALYMSFMPLYMNELGYSTFWISIVIAIRGLAGMLSRYVLNWIMKRTHLERILTVAGMIAAVCVLLTPLASLHIIGIIVLVLVMGAAAGVNLPVSIMIVVNDTKDSDRGKLMGLRLLTNRFSQILSPAMFGILGQTVGLSFAFMTGGVFLISMMFGFSMYTSKNWDLKTDGRDKAKVVQPDILQKP